MGHATSNANDAGGHCRLPRKYIRSVQSKYMKKNGEEGEGKKRKVTTLKLMHDYNKLLRSARG